MSNNVDQRSWATPEQWEFHRETITTLYETHALKKVMKIMEEAHDFYATVKMYKTHFTRWGLQKNLRSKQVQDLVHQKKARDEAGKATKMYIRGKEVDAKRLDTYISRTSAQNRSWILCTKSGNGLSPGPQSPMGSVVACRTPSPIPLNRRARQSSRHIRSQDEKEDQNREGVTEFIVTQPVHGSTHAEAPLFLLSAPDALRRAQKCMYYLHAYVNQNFTSGHWKDAIGPEEQAELNRVADWGNMISDVVNLLNDGQTQRAFQLIHTCFGQYKSLLSANSISLLLETYCAVSNLECYLELASQLIRFANKMSEMTNGATHPLSLLLREFSNMTFDEIMLDYRPLADCFDGLLAGYFQHKSELMFEATGIRLSSIIRQCNCGLIDFKVAEAAIIKDSSMWQSFTGDSSSRAVICKYFLCRLYYLHDRYDDLRSIGSEILLRRRDPGILQLLAGAARRKGDCEEAIRLAEDSLDLYLHRYGPTDYDTIHCYNVLQRALRKSGQVARADAVQEQWEQGMDMLCGRLEKTTLDGNEGEEEVSIGSNDSGSSQNQVEPDKPHPRGDLLPQDLELEPLLVTGELSVTFEPWTPPIEHRASCVCDEGAVGCLEIDPLDMFEQGFFDL